MYDDDEWEGPETLTVELELDSNSVGVEIPVETSHTQVIIDDPDDSE